MWRALTSPADPHAGGPSADVVTQTSEDAASRRTIKGSNATVLGHGRAAKRLASASRADSHMPGGTGTVASCFLMRTARASRTFLSSSRLMDVLAG